MSAMTSHEATFLTKTNSLIDDKQLVNKEGEISDEQPQLPSPPDTGDSAAYILESMRYSKCRSVGLSTKEPQYCGESKHGNQNSGSNSSGGKIISDEGKVEELLNTISKERMGAKSIKAVSNLPEPQMHSRANQGKGNAAILHEKHTSEWRSPPSPEVGDGTLPNSYGAQGDEGGLDDTSPIANKTGDILQPPDYAIPSMNSMAYFPCYGIPVPIQSEDLRSQMLKPALFPLFPKSFASGFPSLVNPSPALTGPLLPHISSSHGFCQFPAVPPGYPPSASSQFPIQPTAPELSVHPCVTDPTKMMYGGSLNAPKGYSVESTYCSSSKSIVNKRATEHVIRKSKKRIRTNPAEGTHCHQCGTKSTPEWRRGPEGLDVLCNACGLYHAKMLRKKGEKEAMRLLKERKSTNNKLQLSVNS